MTPLRPQFDIWPIIWKRESHATVRKKESSINDPRNVFRACTMLLWKICKSYIWTQSAVETRMGQLGREKWRNCSSSTSFVAAAAAAFVRQISQHRITYRTTIAALCHQVSLSLTLPVRVFSFSLKWRSKEFLPITSFGHKNLFYMHLVLKPASLEEEEKVHS